MARMQPLMMLLLCLPLLLAACQPQAPAPESTTAETPPEPAAAAQDDEPVTASYACDGGNRVDLIREGRVARLSLSDGRTIRLGQVAGSSPRTWMDVGLRFVVDDDYAELSQLNRERSLACEPAPSD